MPTVTATSSPAAQPLYDARRGVYYAKPALRGWLHLLCFGASLVSGPLLLAGGRGAARITAVAIYSASVSALFGISALYHRGTWTEAGRRRLQRLDHAMIFFLIAGTATPAFLLDAPGAFGLACLIVMWTLTLSAVSIHLAWMNAPELLVGGTFVGLGWAAGLSLPWVWIHAACSTPPERFPTTVAGPIRTRPCSGTTRSFTPMFASPRPASTSR
jgi:hemolysin III